MFKNIPDALQKLEGIDQVKAEIKRLLFETDYPHPSVRDIVVYVSAISGVGERTIYKHVKNIKKETMKYQAPEDVDIIRISFYGKYEDLFNFAYAKKDDPKYLKIAAELLEKMKEFFPDLIKKDKEKDIKINIQYSKVPEPNE